MFGFHWIRKASRAFAAEMTAFTADVREARLRFRAGMRLDAAPAAPRLAAKAKAK